MKLTLGETTMEGLATPGHTPGTLSYVFPVKDASRTLMVANSVARYFEMAGNCGDAQHLLTQ